MNYKIFQQQYDKIYSFFKTTCEPFDFLEWDGQILQVWQNNKVIEIYYPIWEFGFKDIKDYNSIKLVKSNKFRIKENK